MASKYPSCKYTKKPDFAAIKTTKEAIDEFTSNYRIFPTYEKSSSDFVHRKYYSLTTNEYLACRWIEFKNEYFKRTSEPLILPSVTDSHFLNYKVQFKPSEGINSKTDFRLKMKPGPGVDKLGSLPIPVELLMKRVAKPKTEH